MSKKLYRFVLYILAKPFLSHFGARECGLALYMNEPIDDLRYRVELHAFKRIIRVGSVMENYDACTNRISHFFDGMEDIEGVIHPCPKDN